jgi:hypothetical protein
MMFWHCLLQTILRFSASCLSKKNDFNSACDFVSLSDLCLPTDNTRYFLLGKWSVKSKKKGFGHKYFLSYFNYWIFNIFLKINDAKLQNLFLSTIKIIFLSPPCLQHMFQMPEPLTKRTVDNIKHQIEQRTDRIFQSNVYCTSSTITSKREKER